MTTDSARFAVGLLSVLPAGSGKAAGAVDRDVAGRALRWVLPIGIVLGGIAALVLLAAEQLGLAPLTASILAIATLAGLTRGMHLDGLADTADGLVVVTPDGKDSRVISQDIWIAYTWSADSRQIYGLREADRVRHYELAAIDIATMKERVINPELGVIPPASQPIRGLALMGSDSLVTSIASARSDIWLAEGLEAPRRSLLSRLWRGN